MASRRSRGGSPAIIIVIALILLAGAWAQAQPSGGPYGPLPQTYEAPKLAAHVYYVAPDGQADASGTTLTQPTTLEAAVARVVTGDAIILRGGVYRIGGLKLNQGITMQPYADERPVLKGTQIATKWEALRGNVWRTSWTHLFPAGPLGWWMRAHQGMHTPLHRFNNDMVFIDGESLLSAGWEGELDAHLFYIDYEAGHVYIGADPTNRLVEITAWDSALVRTTRPCHGKTSDGKGPIIRGITFTQYAYRALDFEGKKPATPATEEPTNEPEGPADPATFGKEVVGTTLDHVTISHCSRVAGYFRGDKLTIRHSLISDTTTEGVYVIGSSDVLLEKNIFRRNNVERLTGYFPSAVKIFNQSRRVTCRDNLVIDLPHSNGVWYDVGTVDGVFVDNWVEGALDGFFFEISKGAICAGNVFVDCAHGVRALNSSNVRVYHNTLINSPAAFARTPRSAAADHFGWHAATAPDVDQRDGHVFVGNLLVADESYDSPLLRVDQMGIPCERLATPQLKQLAGNAYIRRGGGAQALVVWSPAAGEKCRVESASLDALRQLQPELEAGSLYLSDYRDGLFKSPELHNYELVTPLPMSLDGLVPSEILVLLGWSEKEARTPGAYPARR
ncbi:MAG: right-handed parallel beta-helix repeat-containing protein [Vicinamibacteria bacterium]|nr:right-handed parallel beta-helix repeat-containing protein [Vicinamibacteria bacterium]